MTSNDVERIHDYRDENGKLSFQVVIHGRNKAGKKIVSQRRPNGAGGYLPGRGDTPDIPYRLPELLRSDITEPGYVPEGENDCDNLAAIGLVATTNPGGARWPPEMNPYLAGRHLVILFDNDEVGRRRPNEIAQSILSVAASVRIVDLGLTEKGADVTDWLRDGGTREALEALVSAAPFVTGATNPAPVLTALDAAIARLNLTHAVVREGGKTTVVIDQYDPVRDRHVLDRAAFSDVKQYFCNELVDVGDKKLGLGSVWLNHCDRRQYEGIVFAPGREVPGYLNLWRGFSVVPKPGDWSLYKDHVLENICGGNGEHYDYVMAWLAFGVQHPGEPAEVAIVLRGGRGTGKGIFAKQYGVLFGQHYLQISQAAHLTGNFNAHLQDCVILFVDEAFWAGDKQGEAVLKTLITEDAMVVEPKHVNAFSAKNSLHLIMASNNLWVVPAGCDERRYFVLNVGDAHRQDFAYFAALLAQLEAGGRAAMLHDLQAYDLSTVNLRCAPATNALVEQKILSMHPDQRWWYEKLISGSLLGDDGWMADVAKAALHDDYVASLKNSGVSRRSTETGLGVFIRRAVPGGLIEPLYEFKRCNKSYWHFPPLAVCRAAFDHLMGSQHPWPDDDDMPTPPTSGGAKYEVGYEFGGGISAPI